MRIGDHWLEGDLSSREMLEENLSINYNSQQQPSLSVCSSNAGHLSSLKPNFVQKLALQDQNNQSFYFISFFSPRETAESLQRRNENLEMLSFQNSDEEPDDVINRRKKKASDLLSKEEHQLQLLEELKIKENSKYEALKSFVKFFCLIKKSLVGARTDYYSSKTFYALKNSSEEELTQVTKVVKKMYENIMRAPKVVESHCSFEPQLGDRDQRLIEFLIIPRFLISKQKLNRLSRDESLQKNFEFLIIHECLGHYNNEANKKMPEEKQMNYVRRLLQKDNGRQKFKRICSINHGNKFLKSYGPLYFDLYSKTLKYLKHLDNEIKKGKKYEMIKRDLEKMNIETEETVGNSSCTENQSLNGFFNFKNFKECLNKMQQEQDSQSLIEQLRDNPLNFQLDAPLMKKGKIRKLMSEPLLEEVKEPIKRTFKLRKSLTIPTPKTTPNIILIQPPQSTDI